jgi:4-amino-4-deoxy-L-arabinose transferase-like glycosyltransferase
LLPLKFRGWLLALVCCAALWFLYFFGLTRVGVLGPDEPRYAAIGRAMSDSGDWITPRLWGRAWFEKPALLYWMTGAAFRSGLGPESAPRVPVALVSVAFLMFFFWELRRQFGPRAGFFSALILGTSAGWLAYSHVGIPDLPMSAAFSVAMLCILPGDLSRGRIAAAGIFLGLAVLAKGLVPLVLFVPAIWFLRRGPLKLAAILGGAALVAAPWYLLVASRNGSAFFAEFVGHQQFARFVSGEFLHVQPFWYYAPVLAAGLFPWSAFALLLFSGQIYQDRRTLFLAVWFIFGFVFFSASRGKLPHYLLPLLPSLAALIGLAVDRARQRSAMVMFALAAGAGLLWLIPTLEDALPQALIAGIRSAPLHFFTVWLAPALLLAMACATLEFARRRSIAIGVMAACSTLLIARIVWRDFPALDGAASARGLWMVQSQSIQCIPRDRQFLRYGLYYYAGRELPDCN